MRSVEVNIVLKVTDFTGTVNAFYLHSFQPRSQGLFPGLGAGWEKALALAGHVPTLHPEILGVIN